jgi:hypothetical protein
MKLFWRFSEVIKNKREKKLSKLLLFLIFQSVAKKKKEVKG